MTVNKAMTDIEKWTFKVRAVKAVAIGASLVICTWQLSSVFNRLVNKIESTDQFVRAQTRKDSVRDERIAQLQRYRGEDRHDIDSLSEVFKAVTLRVRPSNLGYYTQQWINGKLVKTPYHQ